MALTVQRIDAVSHYTLCDGNEKSFYACQNIRTSQKDAGASALHIFLTPLPYTNASHRFPNKAIPIYSAEERVRGFECSRTRQFAGTSERWPNSCLWATVYELCLWFFRIYDLYLCRSIDSGSRTVWSLPNERGSCKEQTLFFFEKFLKISNITWFTFMNRIKPSRTFADLSEEYQSIQTFESKLWTLKAPCDSKRNHGRHYQTICIAPLKAT